MLLYRFGPFEVKTASGELMRDGLRLKLAPKPFACLVELLDRAGEVVTRDDLHARLWPRDTFVDFENNLNNAIARIRQVLCDDEASPRFLETIRGKGYRFLAPVAPEVTRRMIAVLPFRDLSEKPRAFFSQGIAEELISSLASLNPARLGVIGRASAVQIGASAPREIAETLGVDYFVEGSIRRLGNRVRVTARLNDARTLEQVWTATYVREWRGALALESELARAIAEEIRVPYVPRADAPLPSAAFEHYLRGRHFWSRFTADACRSAIREYEAALALDPRHAMSHAGISHACILIADNVVGGTDVKAMLTRADESAERALALDPMLASAHTARAMVFWRRDWNWAKARAAFERAAKLPGFHAYDHMRFAWLLSALGDHAGALSQIEQARRLEPLALPIVVNRGWLLYHAGRFAEARALLEDCLRLEPAFWLARIPLSYCLEELGDTAGAARVVKESGSALRGSAALKAAWGRALAISGDSAGARRAMEDPALRSFDRATIQVALRRKRDAIASLRGAIEEGASMMSYVRVDAVFARLRGNAEFEKLARRIGL